MIAVDEIARRLADRCEELAHRLLPNARRDGNLLRIGSIEGEPGQSMAIYLAGERRGTFKDFAGDAYGDMLDLIEASLRLAGKGEAVAWAKQWLGIEDGFKPGMREDPGERARQAEAARARALAEQQREAKERAGKIRGAKALYLHQDSVAIAGTPADYYLSGRMLDAGPEGRWPNVLRFHPAVYCRPEQCKVPAMLAAAYLADGTQVATHRTFLQLCERRGWVKIDSPNAKMVLGPIGGAFIPINKGASGKSMRHMPAGEAVYVTEGIEDALTVRMKKPEARIVAAYSVGNIGAIVLPAAAKKLVIVADRDEKPKAQEALERAIARQQARGLEVAIVMPPIGVKDFNEWLQASLRPPAGRRA